MMNDQNMKLSTKLISGFALPVIMLFVIAALIYSNINSLLKANFWVNHTHEVISEGKGLLGSMVDMETGMRGYLVAGKEEYLDPYIAGQKSFTDNINKLKKTVDDNPRQVRRLKKVEELSKNWLTKAAEIQINMRREVKKSQIAVEHFNEISSRTVGKEKFDGLREALIKVDQDLKHKKDLKGQYILQGILMDMINQETGQRGFLLSGDEASLAPFKDGQLSFERHVAELNKHWDKVSYRATTLRNSLEQVVALAQDWKNEAAIPEIDARREMNKIQTSMSDITEFIDQGVGKNNMDTLRGVIAEFINEEAGLIKGRITDADKIGERTILTALISALLSAIIVSVAAFVIIKSIQKEVGGEPAHIANIASLIAEGDLSVDLSKTGKESGIYSSMIDMTERLRDMITNISLSAESQSAASEELSSISEQTGKNVQQQYSLIDEITVAIEQMGATSEDMAKQTNEVARSANEARTLVDHGTQQSEQVSENIQSLSNNLSNVAEVIDELDVSVSNISNILDVIKGIADQTNLLALNAAIEAARAGEQGRGFAVVADEVRTLAQNTQNSTTEIEEMITKVQHGTKASVQAMSNGRKQADIIVDQTVEMKGVLGEIKGSVHNITDMAALIATAAEEQSVVVNDVSTRSLDIRDLTQQTGEGSQQIATSTESLKQLAIGLTKHVNLFKM